MITAVYACARKSTEGVGEGGRAITSLKIVAGTLVVVVGIVVGFIELGYAPHILLLGIRWLLTSVTAILYIVLDYLTGTR